MLSKLKMSILIGSFLVLAVLPFITQWIDEPFYVDLMARVMIFSIAASAARSAAFSAPLSAALSISSSILLILILMSPYSPYSSRGWV